MQRDLMPLSVVIVCKNEADVIARTLESLDGLTDDIIVYDNGSTDDTVAVAKNFNVHVAEGSWEGFGKTKRKAIMLAKYDWILSLDADEAIDDELRRSIRDLALNDAKKVYDLKFKNFLGHKYLRYGEWGGDKHIRLFNRQKVNWNDAPVHEQLILPTGTNVEKISGYVLHQTVKNIPDYALKTQHYAMLNADKYFQQGRKASWFKIRIAPRFAFFHYYILKLGFLDGYAGYVCARMTAYYTFLKYTRLKELAGDQKLTS